MCVVKASILMSTQKEQFILILAFSNLRINKLIKKIIYVNIKYGGNNV